MIPKDLWGHTRYEVLEQLGAGAMGIVYKAIHVLMDRVVALKVIHPWLVGRPGMAERFRREIRAAARLSHRNIVTAYDAEQTGDTHFLVMEFVEGTNLEQVAQEQGPLPIDRACDYARQAAWGLQHAHERSMVHRDIKPHNLMRTPQGTIKILDFGLARFVSEAGVPGEQALCGRPYSSEVPENCSGLNTLVSDQISTAGSPLSAYPIAGTPDYMAPEEIQDPRNACIRADIYSLGCTLYRFLARQVPFPRGVALDKMRRHLTDNPIPLGKARPDVPGELDTIVQRMMAKNPADRYQTPSEVALALSPFVSSSLGHILVVEDNLAAREAMALMLKAEGYEVSQAANGREALERLRTGPRPILVLLDLVMPVMDGWQFLKERESDPMLAEIPVVVVSASDPRHARAAALGAAGYLQKPATPDELVGKVRRYTGEGAA